MRLTKKSKDNFLYEGKHIAPGQSVVIESSDEAKLEKLDKIEFERPLKPPRQFASPSVGTKTKRSRKKRY